MSWLTRSLVRTLELFGRRAHRPKAEHLATGSRGETEAFFFLQKLGYRVVATNFRVAHDRGEIDLIGWEGDVLCFVEVKTRADISFAPPSSAVTRDKQRHIIAVARRYLRRLPGGRPASCRFDIVSVVPRGENEAPALSLRKGTFSWDTDRPRRQRYRDFATRDTRHCPRLR